MSDITVARCLQLASELELISDSARLDVELILCHALQKNRTWLFTWPDTTLTAEQYSLFNDYFQRRKTGEPIAHIIGQREFWSLPLQVNNSTLIPRPDTELLVAVTLELFAQDERSQRRRCLDLGTGSGAIVLALASEKPGWQLVGVDKSPEAVQLAQSNRARLNFNHVTIFRSDWFTQLDEGGFDVIISNPPYIDPLDPHLTQGDVRFEPRSALIAEKNGLADLETIVHDSWNHLHNHGWLLLEHGYDQGEKVRDLLRGRGFAAVDSRRDLSGHERLSIGQKIMGAS